MPCRVVTDAGTLRSVRYREPSGKAAGTSTGFACTSGEGSGAPSGVPQLTPSGICWSFTGPMLVDENRASADPSSAVSSSASVGRALR